MSTENDPATGPVPYDPAQDDGTHGYWDADVLIRLTGCDDVRLSRPWLLTLAAVVAREMPSPSSYMEGFQRRLTEFDDEQAKAEKLRKAEAARLDKAAEEARKATAAHKAKEAQKARILRDFGQHLIVPDGTKVRYFDPVLRKATATDLSNRWGGAPAGKRFRCYLCGHKFVEGDPWRPVYANGTETTPAVGHGNFFVCQQCDGPDVLERWAAHCREADQKFWWMHNG